MAPDGHERTHRWRWSGPLEFDLHIGQGRVVFIANVAEQHGWGSWWLGRREGVCQPHGRASMGKDRNWRGICLGRKLVKLDKVWGSR